MSPDQVTAILLTAAVGAGVAAVCWYLRRALERVEAAEVAIAVAESRIEHIEQEIIRLRDKVHHLAGEVALHMLKE